jgi:hypothetical protein
MMDSTSDVANTSLSFTHPWEPRVNLLLSFPTVIFTFLLAVCVLWWLASMLLAGLDVDLDNDGSEGLGDHLGFTSMPLPLTLSFLSLGGWVTTALLQRVLGSANDDFRLSAVGAGGVLVAAIAAGLLLVKLFSKPLGRLFATEVAPTRRSTVGSFCKIRTLQVSKSFGHAEVLNGPTRGALIAVRAEDGRFTRGDTAQVIDYDEASNSFVIDDIDELVRPD